MSLYQFIAGVADDGFRTGWSGPTDPRFPDTCAKRHVMAARLGFSTGKGKKPPSTRSGTGDRGGGVSRAPETPSEPPSSQHQRKKCQGRGFWKRGVPSFLPPSFSSSYCTGKKLQKCCVAAPVKFATGGIIRSIVNESCHRRCFAWLALIALHSRECPVSSPQPLFFLPACESQSSRSSLH